MHEHLNFDGFFCFCNNFITKAEKTIAIQI